MDLDLSPYGASTLVTLYAADANFDDNGTPLEGAEIIYSGITDLYGRIYTTIHTNEQDFLIRCNGMAVPATSLASVKNHKLTFTYTPETVLSKTSGNTRSYAYNDYKLFDIDAEKGVYSIVNWNPEDPALQMGTFYDDTTSSARETSTIPASSPSRTPSGRAPTSQRASTTPPWWWIRAM